MLHFFSIFDKLHIASKSRSSYVYVITFSNIYLTIGDIQNIKSKLQRLDDQISGKSQYFLKYKVLYLHPVFCGKYRSSNYNSMIVQRKRAKR